MSTRKEIIVTYLPIILSGIAIIFTGYGEYRRSTEAKSSYNQSRIELFRQMTAQAKNQDEIMTIYGKVFPNDEKILRGEQSHK